MPTSLIGIGGALTAGKDTLADYLVEEYDFKKHWMSEPLNEALLILNPVIEIDSDHFKVRYARLVAEVGYTRAKEHPEVRRLLQVLGTEIGRKMIDEEIWVKLAAKKVDESRHVEGRNVTITGIRFKNELEMIRKRGGILLYIDRPGLVKKESSGHDSENSLQPADFDFVVPNVGTLRNFYDTIDFELGTWLSRSSKNELTLF